jgi:pyrophosphatase PpaX
MAELRAHRHPTAIVTSKMTDLAERALRFTGLRETIDIVIGVEQTTRHKPDPEPVRLALERLGYESAESVFLGDSPHDIAAGKAAGVTTVAARWGPFSAAELEGARPTHVLANIREFPPLVASLEGRRTAVQ